MIEPAAIADANIVSTDVAEDLTLDEWDSGTTYDTGDQVWRGERQWQAAADGLLAVDPLTDTAGNWTDLAAATRWRPFDGVLGRHASRATSLYYRLATPAVDLCDAVAAFNVVGGTIRHRVWNGATKLYDETRSLVDQTGYTDLLELLTWNPDYSTSQVEPGLNLYAGYEYRIDVDAGAGGTAQIGELALGRTRRLGAIEEFRADMDDLSTVERNEYGELIAAEIIDRPDFINAEYRLRVLKRDAARVMQALARRQAKFTAFYAEDADPGLGATLYGIPRQPRLIQVRGPVAEISLTVLGTT